MGNMFDMIKQAASMKKEMKRIQKELERSTVEHSVGGGKITVVARGDMSIKSITIAPEVMDGDAGALADLVVKGVNGALEAAKKKAGAEMSKLTGGMGGLGDLLS